MARLRLRLPAGAGAAGRSWPTTSRSSPGCSGRAGRRGRGRTPSVHDAIHEPKGLQQPRIPILVGGNGPKVTWRLAARFADELNLDALTPAQVEAAMPVIRERCAEVGRDPATPGRLGLHLGRGRRRRRGRGAAPAVPRLRGPRPGPGDRPGVRPREGPPRDRRRDRRCRGRGPAQRGRRRPGVRTGVRGEERAVASPQTGIFALGTSSHAYLEFDLLPGCGPAPRRRARRVAARAADHDRRGQPRGRVPPGALGEPGAGQRARPASRASTSRSTAPTATRCPRPSTTSSCGSPAPATTSSSTCRAPSSMALAGRAGSRTRSSAGRTTTTST